MSSAASGDARPLGIFDSGIGGLSVWREVRALLPHESTVYVADQAHVPYGPRPAEQILELTLAVARFLQAQQCKLIVVACNSASAAALQHLRRAFPQIPFVGMEPAIKPASAASLQRVAGVLATPATLAGELYRGTVARHARDMQIVASGCPGLVDAIEACAEDAAISTLLEGFVAPARQAGADVMVLACTHYPLVKQLVASACGPSMAVLDPAPAVARQAARLLTEGGLGAALQQRSQHRFLTTASTARRLEKAMQHWLGLSAQAETLTLPPG